MMSRLGGRPLKPFRWFLPVLVLLVAGVAGCQGLPRIAVRSSPTAVEQPPTPVPTATSVAELPTATPMPSPTPLSRDRILQLPIYHQEHALSCEAAALRMAMAGLGKAVAEDDLLAELARDPTPRRVLPDGSVQWGDPDVGFVGQWDGAFLKDGYGVYEEPIARLAVARGFSGTTRGRDMDPAKLYDAVRHGFPVVVWMPFSLQVRGRGFWTTPAGKRVDYVVTEHAVVLAGVDGQGVYFADPVQPTLQRASYPAFEAALSELGRRAVVVRP